MSHAWCLQVAGHKRAHTSVECKHAYSHMHHTCHTDLVQSRANRRNVSTAVRAIRATPHQQVALRLQRRLCTAVTVGTAHDTALEALWGQSTICNAAEGCPPAISHRDLNFDWSRPKCGVWASLRMYLCEPCMVLTSSRTHESTRKCGMQPHA